MQWQKHRIEKPALDFLKGDFSNPHFMRSFDRNFDIGVVYDILLHQAPLLQTLHLMLEKVRHRFCIVQPMLREQSLPNTLVYLPGNTRRDLYPMSGPSAEFLVFDVRKVNHSPLAVGPDCLLSPFGAAGGRLRNRVRSRIFSPFADGAVDTLGLRRGAEGDEPAPLGRRPNHTWTAAVGLVAIIMSKTCDRIETDEVAAGDTGFRGQGSKNSRPGKQLRRCPVKADGALAPSFGKGSEPGRVADYWFEG